MDFIYDESGRPFALKYSTNGGSSFGTYYYVLNLQGDVVKLVNASGTAVATYTYNAWGEILTSTGTMADINPLRYRGYYYDTETGFYYLQSRYYDPVTHRFINADSLASTGQGILGINMFAYCLNNPVRLTDEGGMFPGEWFETIDEAAEDFANTYNRKSIVTNTEYGTYIYEIEFILVKKTKLFGLTLRTKTERVVYYSYTVPFSGAAQNIKIPYKTTVIEHKTVAVAHTHGAYDLDGNNEVFSNDDYAYVCAHETVAFMVTPNGKIMKLDHHSEGFSPIQISSGIIHDPAARNAERRGLFAWLPDHHCKNCAY